MTEYQSESETMNQESNYELSPEFEFSQEYNQEYMGEANYELLPEFESYETATYESSYEMELANELMEVSNEAEFFDWLKSTAKKAAGVASSFLDSPTGQRATSALTDIAQKTLPTAGAKAGGFVGQKGGEALGGAIGGYFGVGPAGKAVGGWLGQKAGAYGGEKAGQWAADRVPSFVRFATDTIRNLANEVAVKGPNVSIQPSIIKAAQKHYPIILKIKGTISARPVQGNFPMQNEFQGEYQGEYQGEANYEGTFNEVTEMELATELLSINNEAELDRFLGKLFKKAVGGIKKLAGGPLGGILKGIAKKVLPIAGGALGSFIPIPGVGTALGTAAGKAASNLFELELEGLSGEDREFEIARAYVRFAGNAARRAANMRSGNQTRNARLSVINAARKYAPGLVVRRRAGSRAISDYSDNGYDSTPAEGGNWYRQGNRIIIEGA